MCRVTFRVSCLNAATGAVVRSSERFGPVYAGIRPTVLLPTCGPLQKDASVLKRLLRQVCRNISPAPLCDFAVSEGVFEAPECTTEKTGLESSKPV